MSIPASDQVFHVGDQSRREFLQNATAAGLALAIAGSPALAAAKKPDYTLRIAPTSLEIAPGKIIQTIGYNGTIPGPLIRLREGSAATIRVINDSTVPDLVHWHGLTIPSLMDGAMEEGTPMILPGQSASYTFIRRPAGTRWYHTHATAKDDLRLNLYGGQYGFLYVEPGHDPGRYDQEVFIAMHQWEPAR
jgi:FtsP/CotA-like multicopper oxidase with cupredoxin domain